MKKEYTYNELKAMAIEFYGDDPHKYAAQRDGFIEGFAKAIQQINKNDVIDVVMPRYFIDERAGCAAVRDREHPKYDKAYQGLHQDTPDVVVYAHGFQNHEKGCWEMKDVDINYLKLECDRLNRLNGA